MDSESRDAQRLDKMAVSVTQTVERTITGKLEKMVHDQVRDVIAPGMWYWSRSTIELKLAMKWVVEVVISYCLNRLMRKMLVLECCWG